MLTHKTEENATKSPLVQGNSVKTLRNNRLSCLRKKPFCRSFVAMPKLSKIILMLVLGVVVACLAVFALRHVHRFLPKKKPAPERHVVNISTPDPLVVAYEAATSLLAQGKTAEARQAFATLVAAAPRSPQAAEAAIRLGVLNAAELFSPLSNEALKENYTVVSGDSISRIAAKSGVTMEALVLVNNLASTNIRAGQQLLMPIIDVSGTIDSAKKTVTVYNNDEFFRAYPIAKIAGTLPTAAAENDTPLKVTERIALADGQRVNFENKLFPDSSRHLALTPGDILIRTVRAPGEVAPPATPPPATSSRNVRPPPAVTIYLAPEDINELYLLVPTGTAFTIQ